MKKLFLPVFVLLLLTSCQNNKKQSDDKTIEASESATQEDLNILEKVAIAYGYEAWSEVESVNFSFVVNPGQEERLRQWTWYPQKDEVVLHQDEENINYQRDNLTEEFVNTDKAFVNDSFWLLFPYHLVWDDIEYEVEDNAVTPIHKRESTKLIVNYPDKGGYTPGDRYDVYLNENYHIIEWAYYPSGQDKPALTNTFEDLSNFDGIKINIIHQNPETGFQLNFRDVSVN